MALIYHKLFVLQLNLGKQITYALVDLISSWNTKVLLNAPKGQSHWRDEKLIKSHNLLFFLNKKIKSQEFFSSMGNNKFLR